MIAFDIPQELPSKFLWYLFTKLFLILVVISWFFSFIVKSWIMAFMSILTLTMIIWIPLIIYIYLYYKTFSFQIDKENVIIKSGVIFKGLKTIPFNSAQTVNLNTGPLQGLFGLSTVQIWTSSQSQMQINKGNSEQTPDGILNLDTKDAERVREMITRK